MSTSIKAHVIEDGKSTNIIVVDSLDWNGLVLVSVEDHGGSIGDDWDGEKFISSIPPPGLDTLKAGTRADVNTRREIVLQGGMIYTFPDGGAGTVATTYADKQNLQAIKSRAQDGERNFFWHDTENKSHTLDSTQAIALANAVYEWSEAVWGFSWQLKTRVEDAPDVATLQAIKIYDSWPG